MQSMFAPTQKNTDPFSDFINTMKSGFGIGIVEPSLMLDALLRKLPQDVDLPSEEILEESKAFSSAAKTQQRIQQIVRQLTSKKAKYPHRLIQLFNAFFSFYREFYEKLSSDEKTMFQPLSHQQLWEELWPKADYLQEVPAILKQFKVIPLDLSILQRLKEILQIMSFDHTDKMWIETLSPLVAVLNKNDSDKIPSIVRFIFDLKEKIPPVCYPLIIHPFFSLLCEKRNFPHPMVYRDVVHTLVFLKAHLKNHLNSADFDKFFHTLFQDAAKPMDDGVGQSYAALGNLGDIMPKRDLGFLPVVLMADVENAKDEERELRIRCAITALASLASAKVMLNAEMGLSQFLLKMLQSREKDKISCIDLICDNIEKFAPAIHVNMRSQFLFSISKLLNDQPKMFTNVGRVILALKVFGEETPDSIAAVTEALLLYCKSEKSDVSLAGRVWKSFGAKIPDDYHDEIIQALMLYQGEDHGSLLDLAKMFQPKYAEMIVSQAVKQLEEKGSPLKAVQTLGRFTHFIDEDRRLLVAKKLLTFSEGHDPDLAYLASVALIQLSSANAKSMSTLAYMRTLAIDALIARQGQDKYISDHRFSEVHALLSDDEQSRVRLGMLNRISEALNTSNNYNRNQAIHYLRRMIPDNPNEFLDRFPVIYGRMGAELNQAYDDYRISKDDCSKKINKLKMLAYATTIQTFHNKLTDWYQLKAKPEMGGAAKVF